jgi:Alpha-galactosidases/6-phospho-beta-glucosidases, family 4 of glycosyl hydrolases
MKKFKKLLMVFTMIAVLGSATAAYAATAKTPAEIAAELTGRPVAELYQERAEGKTYGTIANEAGKLEEFQAQMLEQKKLVLDQRVAEGKLTQERADAIYNAIQNNQVSCDGTGNAGIGKNAGAGFGQGSGNGVCNGQGAGAGAGTCSCNGQGLGLGQGRNR